MSFTRLPFTSLPWSVGGHPLERKKLVEGHPVGLLEFAPGFEDPNWCPRGHVIYVLEGALALELTDGSSEQVHAGNGCVLALGTRHRASNRGDLPVRLFIVSTDE